MPLARFDAPFEHADWIFEPKLDGFRTIAYVEGGTCRLVSRNWNAFKTFAPLAEAIGQELARHSAILDDEIVRPGPDGRPMFYELMRRRGPFCFYAFDRLISSGWTGAICATSPCWSGSHFFGSSFRAGLNQFCMWSMWS